MNVRVTVKEAAELMNIPENSLRVAMQQGHFKQIGEAVKFDKQYSYYIFKRRLEKYLEGEPV